MNFVSRKHSVNLMDVQFICPGGQYVLEFYTKRTMHFTVNTLFFHSVQALVARLHVVILFPEKAT